VKPTSKLQQSGAKGVISDQSRGAITKYRAVYIGSSNWAYFIKFELLTSLLIGFPGALGLWLRKTLYPSLFRHCGKNVVFGRNVILRHPQRISIGDNSVIGDDVTLDAKGEQGEGIRLGNGVFIGKGTLFSMLEGTIDIDDGTSIGTYCRIGAMTHTRIGKKVLLAAYVYIVGADHESTRIDIPIIDQPNYSKGGVTIGDGSWLGTKVTVMDGVDIENDSIIGAHAVVAEDIPAYSIALGIPAKVVKNRKDETTTDS